MVTVHAGRRVYTMPGGRVVYPGWCTRVVPGEGCTGHLAAVDPGRTKINNKISLEPGPLQAQGLI